jgi:hypothetical protein
MDATDRDPQLVPTWRRIRSKKTRLFAVLGLKPADSATDIPGAIDLFLAICKVAIVHATGSVKATSDE